jgi:hypothetical protein
LWKLFRSGKNSAEINEKCTEHSLYDMKIHSRHSPRKNMAECNSPVAAGCGLEAESCENSPARSKTLQFSVNICTEHSLHDEKIIAFTRHKKVWQVQWFGSRELRKLFRSDKDSSFL